MAYIDKFGVEYSDDKKTLVRCPKDFEGEYIIPNGTEIIESESFAKCTKLTSITIPDSVTDILTMGNSETNSIFGDFSMAQSLHEIRYTGTLEQWCTITWSRSFFDGAEYDLYIQGSVVDDLVIPNEVREIKPYAFFGCSSIKSIVIPENVTKIGKDAFEFCDNLTTVIFENESMSLLESIGLCRNRSILIATCDMIIHKAKSNMQDLNDYKSPLTVSWDTGKGVCSVKDTSIDIPQLVEKLYNCFVFEYVSRVRAYLANLKDNTIFMPVADYLNICLKKKKIEDYKSLTTDNMSVPLPSIVPYQFIEGTQWSYGDLLGNIHMLCLVY